MLGSQERAHVAAGLGDDHLGGATVDPWDRAERLNGRREPGDLRLDLGGELGDRSVEIVDVREHPADDDRVLVIESALERLAQRRELEPQFADLR